MLIDVFLRLYICISITNIEMKRDARTKHIDFFSKIIAQPYL